MCYCDDDYGVLDFQNTTRPRARKPHRCVECRRTIRPGEVYVRTVQKWEGDISASVFCVECDEWASALCKAQQIVCNCSGWELGNLWGEIREFTAEHLGYSADFDPEDPEACGYFGELDPKLIEPRAHVDNVTFREVRA